VLLRNWVDLEAIQLQGTGEAATDPYRRELGVPEEVVELEYSGSMNKKQGRETLVAVIKQLADVPNLLWLLAGEGPTKGGLIEATAGLDQVRMLRLQPVERLTIDSTWRM
jgi:colanic acid biosynthesis glycosyl transferase WcaI